MQPGVSQKDLLAPAAYATAHSSRFPVSLSALLQFFIALPVQWCNINFEHWGLVRIGRFYLQLDPGAAPCMTCALPGGMSDLIVWI